MGSVLRKTEEPQLSDQEIEYFLKLVESSQKEIEKLREERLAGNHGKKTDEILPPKIRNGWPPKQPESEDTRILKEYLLFSATDHDVVFKVKNKVFKAHRNMLRARSPVFETMFNQKMKGSTDGIIQINDCDPDAFGQLLEFIYTGEVENVSPHDALELYSASDKYHFPALKRKCVDLLKNSLSIKFICNVLMLAVNHDDQDLLQNVITVASEHLEEIMETTEWQRFLTNNPIQAKELSLRALQKRRASSLR